MLFLFKIQRGSLCGRRLLTEFLGFFTRNYAFARV
jgi:hypothetical protein